MKRHCLKALGLWLALIMMMATSTVVFADEDESCPKRKPRCIDVCNIVIRSLEAVNTIVGNLNDIFATQGSVSQIGPISNADPATNPVIGALFAAEVGNSPNSPGSIREAGAEVDAILRELGVKRNLRNRIVETISGIVADLLAYSTAVNLEAPLDQQQAILNRLFDDARTLGKLFARTSSRISQRQITRLALLLVQGQAFAVQAFKGVLEGVPADQQTAQAVALDQQNHRTISAIGTIVARSLAKDINQDCRER